MKEIMQQHSPQPTCINLWTVSLLAPSRNVYSCKPSHSTVLCCIAWHDDAFAAGDILSNAVLLVQYKLSKERPPNFPPGTDRYKPKIDPL